MNNLPTKRNYHGLHVYISSYKFQNFKSSKVAKVDGTIFRASAEEYFYSDISL